MLLGEKCDNSCVFCWVDGPAVRNVFCLGFSAKKRVYFGVFDFLPPGFTPFSSFLEL